MDILCVYFTNLHGRHFVCEYSLIGAYQKLKITNCVICTHLYRKHKFTKHRLFLIPICCFAVDFFHLSCHFMVLSQHMPWHCSVRRFIEVMCKCVLWYVICFMRDPQANLCTKHILVPILHKYVHQCKYYLWFSVFCMLHCKLKKLQITFTQYNLVLLNWLKMCKLHKFWLTRIPCQANTQNTKHICSKIYI